MRSQVVKKGFLLLLCMLFIPFERKMCDWQWSLSCCHRFVSALFLHMPLIFYNRITSVWSQRTGGSICFCFFPQFPTNYFVFIASSPQKRKKNHVCLYLFHHLVKSVFSPHLKEFQFFFTFTAHTICLWMNLHLHFIWLWPNCVIQRLKVNFYPPKAFPMFFFKLRQIN